MRRLLLVLVLLATPAWGAYTGDLVTGFETDDLTECASSSGTPESLTAADLSDAGDRGFRTNASGEWCIMNLVTNAADGANHIFGFRFRASDATPTSAGEFARVMHTAAGADPLKIRLLTDGTIRILDEGGATAYTTTGTLSDNTIHHLEFYYQATATGTIEVFIDGVSDGTGTGDFSSGSAHDQVRIGSMPTTDNFDYDDLYFFRSVTNSADRCSVSATRWCEVFAFAGGPASVTPDTGDNLDTGTWAALSEFPLNAASGAEYTNNGAVSGDVDTDDVGTGVCSTGGPNGCGDFDGDPMAANWLLYAERGTGSSATFNQRWGNSVDAVTETALSMSTNPNMFRQADSGSQMPTASEYCSVGISKSSGNQNYEPWEQWCYVLHREPEPAAAARRVLMIGS